MSYINHNNNTNNGKVKILLVHGEMQGAWCWERVIPYLARANAAVAMAEAIDLPGHGQDQTPLEQVTLAAYIQKVADWLDQHVPLVVGNAGGDIDTVGPAPEQEQAILVGHSLGGLVISAIAEQRPAQVKKLIYVSGFLPQSGQNIAQLLAPSNPEAADLEMLARRNVATELTVTPWGWYTRPRPGPALNNLFYNGCSSADAEWATHQLCPQAMSPLYTQVLLSKERFGRIPKAYIECYNDQALSLSLQRRMHAAQPCHKIYHLSTGHSPFLAAPQELATLLLLEVVDGANYFPPATDTVAPDGETTTPPANSDQLPTATATVAA